MMIMGTAVAMATATVMQKATMAEVMAAVAEEENPQAHLASHWL
jgi:hypothetical protein